MLHLFRYHIFSRVSAYGVEEKHFKGKKKRYASSTKENEGPVQVALLFYGNHLTVLHCFSAQCAHSSDLLGHSAFRDPGAAKAGLQKQLTQPMEISQRI